MLNLDGVAKPAGGVAVIFAVPAVAPGVKLKVWDDVFVAKDIGVVTVPALVLSEFNVTDSVNPPARVPLPTGFKVVGSSWNNWATSGTAAPPLEAVNELPPRAVTVSPTPDGVFVTVPLSEA